VTNYRKKQRILSRGAWALISGLTFSVDTFGATATEAEDAEINVSSGSVKTENANESRTTEDKTGTSTEPSVSEKVRLSGQPTPEATVPVSDNKRVVASAGTSAPPVVSSVQAQNETPRGEKSSYDVSGYLQSQIEFHQDSEDQLRQGGALLNQNRFLIRRGRLRISRDWDWASMVLELDGNTTKGPSARLQKGEASLVYGRSKIKGDPALLALTAGMFELPFGYEMTESAKVRWFMERSIISRALFPGEPDVGMKLHGGAAFLRYSVAVTNGEPLDERSGFGLQDPNANKDVTVRLGVDTKPSESMSVAGGLSYNVGKGFHPGTDATKSSINAQDSNGDGIPESIGVNAGSAAVPSENFSRWAIGADLQLRLKSRIGKTYLYGEVVAAQNLDRGLVIADPTVKDINVREFGGYIGFVQEITRYFVVGLRGDFYDPNADWLDERAGKQIPTSLRVYGLSPMGGFVLPDRARILLQWDIQDNRFARDERGVPSRLKNNAVTARIQVNL
jgi:hypothetical protein